MDNKKWVIAGIVGALVLVGVAGYLMRTPPEKPNAPTVATMFLDDLRSGDVAKVDAAYDATGPGFKPTITKEKFRIQTFTLPRFKKPAVYDFDEHEKDMTWCVFTTEAGVIRVGLRNFDGDWKVEKMEMPK